MIDLSVTCGGLALANPVMPASGTFGLEQAEVFDFDRLGAFVTKTITPEKRLGNPTPRVSEVPHGMLNSIGIPSKGAAAFVRDVIPRFSAWRPPLVVSISANTPDAFADLARAVSVPGVAAIEINISCPNLEDDGKAFAMRPQSTREIVRRLRAATDLPLWAKLTPNAGDVAEVAQAAEDGGADALVVANTILAMSVDVATRRPSLGNVMGGLSGPAVKPIILRMAYQCVRATSLPVVGCGGIATAEDALEFLIVGCRAVQVGTASFIHPSAMIEVVGGLEAYCLKTGLARIEEVIGSLDLTTAERELALEASA